MPQFKTGHKLELEYQQTRIRALQLVPEIHERMDDREFRAAVEYALAYACTHEGRLVERFHELMGLVGSMRAALED